MAKDTYRADGSWSYPHQQQFFMAGFLGLRKMLLGEKDKEKEIQII
jgi:hypothetical protein